MDYCGDFFKYAVFPLNFILSFFSEFLFLIFTFCMTANRTVNAIILVQRGSRFLLERMNVNFYNVPSPPPPPQSPVSHELRRLYISAARVLKTDARNCV